MLGYFVPGTSDIDYTIANINLYSPKDLSPGLKSDVVTKLTTLRTNPSMLTGRIKISQIIEVTFYIVLVFAIAFAFGLWFASSIEGTSGGNSEMQNTLSIIVFSVTGLLLLLHLIFLRLRYSWFERYIQKEIKPLPEKFEKRSISLLGFKMTTGWIGKYENNITGAVYFGAALLVVVVGLRGLGENINSLGFPFPKFLVAEDGLKLGVIFFSLFIEFSLLIMLASFTFFKDVGEGHGEQVQIDWKPVLEVLNSIKANTDLINGESIKNLIEKINISIKEIDGGKFGELSSMLENVSLKAVETTTSFSTIVSEDTIKKLDDLSKAIDNLNKSLEESKKHSGLKFFVK